MAAVDPSLEWSLERLPIYAQVYGVAIDSKVFDIRDRRSESGESANGQLDDQPRLG
jgi:hypothetical protein